MADLNRHLGNCLKKMENGNDDGQSHLNFALKTNLKLLENRKDDPLLLKSVGFCYWNLNNNQQAREYFERFEKSLKNQNSQLSLNDRFSLALVLKLIGLSWINEKNWDDALRSFQLSLKKFLDLPPSLEYEHEIAFVRNKIGEHWLHVYHEKKAKECFEEVENCCELLSQNSKGKYVLAFTYKNLGRALSRQKKPHHVNAKSYCEKAIDLFKNLNPTKFQSEIAWLQSHIGMCFKNLKNPAKAIARFKQALSLFHSLPESERPLRQLAFIKKSIGLCYQYQKQHDFAIEFFENSIETLGKIEESDADKAKVWTKMAYSYKALNTYSKAASSLQKALETYRSISVEQRQQYNEEMVSIKKELNSPLYQRLPGKRRY